MDHPHTTQWQTDALPQPITTAEGLAPLLRAIRSAPEVCMDTEADSLHHYFEKICLLQFTLPELDAAGLMHALVDPLAGLDLTPLFDALKGKPLVLHGADYDLRMLRGDFDFVPSVIFDTMLAARFAGQSGLGLDKLVERYAGKHLDHGAQKADWSQRPLPPRLLKYSVEDTSHLPLIAQKLREELAALGRTEWHRQQCRQLIEMSAASQMRDPEHLWRIKGSFDMDRQSLAILRELWRWRDHEARKWDRPSFMVLSNEKLLELIVWAKEHPREDIRHGPALPKRWPPWRFRTLQEAVRRAWDLPAAQWPLPAPRGKRPPYDPRFGLRLQALRTARDAVAKRVQLNPAILAPNGMLEAIAARIPWSIEDFDSIEKWLPWQSEVLGSPLLESLKRPSAPRGDSSPAERNGIS
ncbi:MAG: HRDC domain-containing protein [Verrucomicrobia bacterium]|nr:HRDC domain-containing protein [Verrucomicrobiota bacterium]